MGEKVLTKPCVLLAQVIFYAWGFYALGEDDTLEVKLTGQPARPPLEVGHAAAVSPSSASLGVQSGEESTASEDSAMEARMTYVGMVPDVLMASPTTGRRVFDGHVQGGSGGEQVRAIAFFSHQQIWERLLGLTGKTLTDCPARFLDALLGGQSLEDYQAQIRHHQGHVNQKLSQSLGQISFDDDYRESPIIWRDIKR